MSLRFAIPEAGCIGVDQNTFELPKTGNDGAVASALAEIL